MNIENLNLVYQQIVNQSNVIPATENTDAVDIKQLYSSYYKKKGGFSKWRHKELCKDIAQKLSDAIDTSALASDKKVVLKSQLEAADFITIVFVLGELKTLLV